MRRALYLSLLFLAASSFAQTVEITDHSNVGSQVSFSGAFTFANGQLTGTCSGRNNSGKSIVLVSYEIVTTYADGTMEHLGCSHDHFFGPMNDYQPGATFVMVPEGGWTLKHTGAVAHAEARAEYVQFSDGTEWGDRDLNTIKHQFQWRADATAFYSHLNDVYNQGGGDALHNAIQQQGVKPELTYHLRRLEQAKGIAAVATNVQEKLAIAQQRHPVLH